MGTLKDEPSTHRPEEIMAILSLYGQGYFVEDIEERFDELKKYAEQKKSPTFQWGISYFQNLI